MAISEVIKRQCVKLANEGLSAREIYLNYYCQQPIIDPIKETSFQRQLQRWRKKVFADDKILEIGNLGYGFVAHGSTVQINKDGEIVQSWIKSSTSDNLYLELIENIKKLPALGPMPQPPSNPDHYMLEIPLYDMHFGISSMEDYTDTLDEVLDIIGIRTYEEINIIIGQDLFHNDDFRGRTSSGREIEKVNMPTAWNHAREFWHHVINKAMKHGIVRIIYSPGNHDESMTWAFVQMLKAQYPTLTVDDDTRDRKCLTYGTNFIGVTHGDKVRGKSINLRSIYTIEYPIEFAGSKVREIHAGHLHHEIEKDEYGVMIRHLSSANKTDGWHYDNGFVGAHKRFMMFEWTRNKLKSIHYV